MAYIVSDLADVFALLREHPQWREVVRRELLGEELSPLPHIIGELHQAQAPTEASLARSTDVMVQFGQEPTAGPGDEAQPGGEPARRTDDSR